MSLEIKLFGHLQIVNPSASGLLQLRQRAQRLLVYLMLHRRARLRRDQLAFNLWPDMAEEEALATLRRALSDLRMELPVWQDGEWVEASSREIQWNVKSPLTLDVEEFERLAQQATPASLHAAVSLYTGDLLPEMDEDWLIAERERLRQLQQGLLHRLIAHHRAIREYNQAIELILAALALDPLAENIHRELISIRYTTGDRAGALSAYDRLRTQLQDELGVEPMPETQDLVQKISRGENLSSTQPAYAVPARSTDPQLSLIGREPEMERLSRWWGNAEEGRGSLGIVSGEVGVGKSDLIQWLVDAVGERKWLVLTGQCYQFERSLPYQPIIEMLRSAVGMLQHTELLPAYRGLLARLVPEFLETVSLPGGGFDLASGDLRPQLYEAMLQAFLTLARLQPLLLAFEHVHWASESTLDWLTYIAPRLAKSRILVIVSCRTTEVGPDHALRRLEQRFSRDGFVHSLILRPFGREATRELVARMSGLTGKRLDPVAECLYRESGGNLFFLRELVRGLQEAGQLYTGQAGTWAGQFVGQAPCNADFLPESLRSAILTRVERLNDFPRKFLKTAAVAGDVFYYKVVRKAEKWSEEQALDALEETIKRGFIQEGENSWLV